MRSPSTGCIPQYVLDNRGMTLDGFKGIFWWEWTHRLLGRLLGVLFIVPFAWFAYAGAIKRSDWPRMLLLFLHWAGCKASSAGGWWRRGWRCAPRSANTGWPSIWAPRFCCWWRYCGSRWNICVGPIGSEATPKGPNAPSPLPDWSISRCCWGRWSRALHAGLIYNTWPDMNGRLLPEDPFFSQPWWINFFENPGLAQFDHRIGAYAVAAFAAFIYLRGIKLSGWAKTSAKAVAAITTFQIGLGHHSR